MVDGNVIRGGCGGQSSAGIDARDSFARIQNNWILGGTCADIEHRPYDYVGLRVIGGLGALDVHSNSISADGNDDVCVGSGITIDQANLDTYRNNNISAGLCSTSFGVREYHPRAEPMIFENNNIDPRGATALYRVDDAGGLTDIEQVNALDPTKFGNNISVDPNYVNYPDDLHLNPGSLCIGAGTPIDAPTRDIDGELRDTAPDIGADEF